MMYRLTDEAAILVVRNQDGDLEYHSACGPEIRWLSPEQQAEYLRLGLVKHVEDE